MKLELDDIRDITVWHDPKFDFWQTQIYLKNGDLIYCSTDIWAVFYIHADGRRVADLI